MFPSETLPNGVSPSDIENAIIDAHTKARIKYSKIPKHNTSLTNLDDLTSAGLLGVSKAILSFDPKFGASFLGYAGRRITGAILDYLRTIDTLGRDTRRQYRENGWDAPTTISLDAPAGRTKQTDERMYGNGRSYGEVCLSHTPNHNKNIEFRDMMDDITDILSERDLYIIKAYYLHGEEDREIGKIYGIGESGINQIRSRAINKIKTYYGLAIPPKKQYKNVAPCRCGLCKKCKTIKRLRSMTTCA